MAMNNSNSLFYILHHVKIISMHEINKKFQQMFVLLDDRAPYSDQAARVFPNVQFLLH